MDKKNCTDFLFSKSTFVSGFGSAFNVVGNYYEFNYSTTEEEADHRAIQCDWEMIAKDLLDAIEAYRIKARQKLTP